LIVPLALIWRLRIVIDHAQQGQEISSIDRPQESHNNRAVTSQYITARWKRMALWQMAPQQMAPQPLLFRSSPSLLPPSRPLSTSATPLSGFARTCQDPRGTPVGVLPEPLLKGLLRAISLEIDLITDEEHNTRRE
jgi:hypothetical protein